MAPNKNRPFIEAELIKQREQIADQTERIKEMHKTLGVIHLGIIALKDSLDCVGNIDWLRQELEAQGKLPKKATT